VRDGRDGRRRNRTLAGLMRALLRSPSQHFRRITDGCFAAGLPLFSDMDQPSQRLHLGQPASKCSHTGDSPARSGPGWFKWERSPAHFVAFPKTTRPVHSPASRAAALVQRRHTRLILRRSYLVASRQRSPALPFPRSISGPGAAACETAHIWVSQSEMFDLFGLLGANCAGRRCRDARG
jgi:hypothetical protein